MRVVRRGVGSNQMTCREEQANSDSEDECEGVRDDRTYLSRRLDDFGRLR